MMTFDPEQNRIQISLLTADERADLVTAKHGYEILSSGHWVNCPQPSWNLTSIYRAKPAPAPTIIVNGIEVPEPVREELEVGRKYWLATTSGPELSIELIWRDHPFHRTRLNRGLIHLTQTAAVAHAKAMLAPSIRGSV